MPRGCPRPSQVQRVEQRVSVKKTQAVHLEKELIQAQLAAGQGAKRPADSTPSVVRCRAFTAVKWLKVKDERSSAFFLSLQQFFHFIKLIKSLALKRPIFCFELLKQLTVMLFDSVEFQHTFS